MHQKKCQIIESKPMINGTRGFNYNPAPDSVFSTQQVAGSSLRFVFSTDALGNKNT